MTITENIEKLKRSLHEKTHDINADKNITSQLLENAVYNAKVIVPPTTKPPIMDQRIPENPNVFYTGNPIASQSMANPFDIAKSQLESRYKTAVTALKTIWYEDHILQVGVVRTVDKTTKVVDLKLFFGNKMSDCDITITKCELGIYDARSLKDRKSVV